jgi:ParB/RepB/Spo0J family partition protein
MTKAKKSKPKAAPLIAPAPAAIWMDPVDLLVWADNPVVHTDEEINETIASIQRFGFGSPILVRTANMAVIAGHRRLAAAIKLELQQVPVRTLDISESEAHVLAVLDNKHTKDTAWDAPKLATLLAEWPKQDAEIAGFTAREIATLSAHLLTTGQSSEIDLTSPAIVTVGHICPQCGCEFFDEKSKGRARPSLDPS